MTKVYSRPVPSALMDARQLKYYIAFRDFAESKNWGLLSDRYVNAETPMVLLCPHDHKVSYLIKSFKSKKDHSVCLTCTHPTNQMTQVEAVNTNIMDKRQLEYYTKLCQFAISKGWKVLSDRFVAVMEPVYFQCPHSHIVELFVSDFWHKDDYTKCKICIRNISPILTFEQRKSQLDPMTPTQLYYYEELLNFAIARKWDILSKKYTSTKIDMLFLCPNLHSVMMKSTNFKHKPDFRSCKLCLGLDTQIAATNFYNNLKAISARPLEEYISPHVAIKCLCSQNHECYVKPSRLQQGSGICLICANRSSEAAATKFYQFIKDQGGYTLENYTKSKIRVLSVCNKGHICTPLPYSINSGGKMCFRCCQRCPEAAKERFEEEMERREYTIVGTYVANNQKVDYLCNKGHSDKATPTNVMTGFGYCSTCFIKSHGEEKTAEALGLLKISCIREHSFPENNRRYDFIIAGFNIEADGIQHFTPGKYTLTYEDLLVSQRVDREKMMLARSKGFRQIRFDYTWYRKSSREFAESIIEAFNAFTQDPSLMVWVSTPSLYTWLDPSLNPEESKTSDPVLPLTISHIPQDSVISIEQQLSNFRITIDIPTTTCPPPEY